MKIEKILNYSLHILNNHPQLDTNWHHTQQKFIKQYIQITE
jgi:hypothetical protein